MKRNCDRRRVAMAERWGWERREGGERGGERGGGRGGERGGEGGGVG